MLSHVMAGDSFMGGGAGGGGRGGPGFIFANRFPLFIAVSLSNPSSVVIFNKTNEEKELVFTLRSICPVRFS